jgi:hypothetical protein
LDKFPDALNYRRNRRGLRDAMENPQGGKAKRIPLAPRRPPFAHLGRPGIAAET